MRKGERTKSTILNEAVDLASLVGLEGLSIGTLAERMAMSKSGLFAHFGSKEDLQIQALKAAQARFEACVFAPAMKQPRGLPRLRAIVENWLQYLDSSAGPGGCMILAAAIEFDDRPGPVRDLLVDGQKQLRGALAKAVRLAIEEGHFRADTDAWQVSFELFGILMASHHDRRLLGDARAPQRMLAWFDRLVRDCGPLQ